MRILKGLDVYCIGSGELAILNKKESLFFFSPTENSIILWAKTRKLVNYGKKLKHKHVVYKIFRLDNFPCMDKEVQIWFSF